MREFLKSFVIAIFIILPVLILILLIYEISNLNYRIDVTEKNINIINNYLENNCVEIEEREIKELVLYDKIYSLELNIIYENNEVEKYSRERLDFDKGFVSYIVENNTNKRRGILGVMLLISIMISIYMFNKLSLKKVIYED